MTTIKLKETVIENKEKSLTLCITRSEETSECCIEEHGSEFEIANAIEFQFKIVHSPTDLFKILIRIWKVSADDKNDYYVVLNSLELKIKTKHLSNNDGSWCEIHQTEKLQISFNISLELFTTYKPMQVVKSFVPLYYDTNLIDFALRGEDGSVDVHKAVLVASSSVFRRKLIGPWREAKEGRVESPGISKTTLQHFKDYLYLHKLPDTGLEHLVSLASFYKIPEMEKNAINKIIENLTAETACDLLDYAFTHKLRKLKLAILGGIQNGVVSVDEMERHLVPEVGEQS